MAVNGIEIKVGQKWRCRNGATVEITETNGTYSVEEAAYPVVTADGRKYMLDGRFLAWDQDPRDLVEVIEDAPSKGVNGVEIKVGQNWRRRDGTEVKIAAVWDNDAVFSVTDTKGQRYTNLGKYEKERNTKFDLVELIEDAPTATLPAPASAPDLLEAAAGHMRDRAATYDKPEGERSMAQTVAIFNLHHGAALTEAQGWHFMQILKDVRLFTNAAQPHRDSCEDGIAYSALKAEALLKGGAQ